MILEGIALFGCWGILRVKAHSQSGLAKLHSLRGLQPCALLSQLVGPQVLRPPGLIRYLAEPNS